MKGMTLIALAATLVLQAHAAEPAHRGPTPSPRTSVRNTVQDRGNYYVPYVKDASGTLVPIMQIPGSVDVVPQQVIQDQQDITMCGALRNASGVSCR
jgi:outer membrane receptor for monomeric catechols